MAYPIQDLNDVLPAPTPMPPISHGEGANKFKKAVGSGNWSFTTATALCDVAP